MRPYARVIAVALCVVARLSRSVEAQTPGAEVRRDIATQSAAALVPAPATPLARERATSTPGALATGSRTDFGEQQIIQTRAHVEPWSVSADGQAFRTDNVALTPSHEQADWYFRYGATIAYTNRIKGPLFIDVALQQYFFRYGKFDALDFDLTRVDGGLILQTPWLADTAWFARYRLERITESGFGSALLTNHVAELGVQKVWKISRGQRVTAALEADLPIDTDPKAAARGEYSLALAYSLRLTERLTAGVSFRSAWYDYFHIDRDDWNNIVSLDATYDFTDWLRLGLSASYTTNASSREIGDYSSFVGGGSVALRLAF